MKTYFVRDPENAHLRRTTFGKGEKASQRTATWIAKNRATLKATIIASGIAGVMKLTGLKRSQAYALIAQSGLNREIFNEKVQQRIEDRKKAQLKHISVTWGWQPGSDTCTIKGHIYCYKAKMIFGKLVIPADTQFFSGCIPKKSVRELLIKQGVKYWEALGRRIPIEEVQGKHIILILQ